MHYIQNYTRHLVTAGVCVYKLNVVLSKGKATYNNDLAFSLSSVHLSFPPQFTSVQFGGSTVHHSS